MANLNKVMLIGRLTRDPEARSFPNGGKVTSFGFAVTGSRKRNDATGQWEDEPCFLDCKAFNSMNERGRKLADLVEQYLRKGHQAYIEGHLVLDQWTSQQDGSKQSRVRVVVDNVEFLQPKDGGMNEGARTAGSTNLRSAPLSRQSVGNFPSENGGFDDAGSADSMPPQQSDQDIPF